MRLQDWSLKMKLTKSHLLGSAAGLFATAGAQAADLPLKAKPVEYVKICSLYGVGFYYIPGTDMCLKVGGWVRAEYAYGDNGNMTWGWANANVNDRSTSNSTWRARGYITADARNQTEYGTVRGYIAVGLSTSNVGLDAASNTFSANRAFIQWAGFTFGLAQSFYDFYSVPATSYWGQFPASDTGDPGWMVLGYTAQFGNGISATLAAEMRRMTAIDNVAAGVGVINAATVLFSVPVLPALHTVASRLPMSSPTCASTRLGVLPRSWALCTRSIRFTMLPSRRIFSRIPMMNWVSRSAPASS
jgi:hypothetical protein